MHGLGNDFVMIDAISQNFSLSGEQIKRLAHRKFGVGFDQLLLVESPSSEDVDFRYRIFNSDGGEVEQCGNGARCFAQFVRARGLTDKKQLRVETMAGVLSLEVHNDSDVTVDMGEPCFQPSLVPFEAEDLSDIYLLDLENCEQLEISVVSVGNPHAVILIENVDVVEVEEVGRMIENHERFPNRTNVQFVQIQDRNTIKQRIFERGAGITAASGSGACAAVAVLQRRRLVDDKVEVQMPGGNLQIYRKPESNNIFMTGPTEFSFEGSFII